jgi:hypothetical protein
MHGTAEREAEETKAVPHTSQNSQNPMANPIGSVGRVLYPTVATVIAVPLYVLLIGVCAVRQLLDLLFLHLRAATTDVNSTWSAEVDGTVDESRWWLEPIPPPASPHTTGANSSSTTRAGGGCHTEWISVGDLAEAKLICVVFPGNPGNPGFYIDYMQQLWQESNRTMTCLCVGHLGHSVRSDLKAFERYNLTEQNMHKVAVLSLLQQRYPTARFVLAGHGAYVWTDICTRGCY